MKVCSGRLRKQNYEGYLCRALCEPLPGGIAVRTTFLIHRGKRQSASWKCRQSTEILSAAHRCGRHGSSKHLYSCRDRERADRLLTQEMPGRTLSAQNLPPFHPVDATSTACRSRCRAPEVPFSKAKDRCEKRLLHKHWQGRRNKPILVH